MPASEVQDPLGLGLRASARLASSLLYCVTSITPRARYFSFLPWCIFDHQQREKGKPHALGLRAGIELREKVLTLGCVAHHDGQPCAGGGLVGSTKASKWFAKGEKQVDLRSLRKFAKNPALNAYIASLINLGMLVTDEERPDSEEEESDETLSFDDIELSELGRDLAERVDREVGDLEAMRRLSSRDRICSVVDLAEFGEHAGLCELPKGEPGDRELLRDVFFRRVELKAEAHKTRRQSLLLLLELFRRMGGKERKMKEPQFAGAVYFGEVAGDGEGIAIEWPSVLGDITMRWRMFYFHHYMSVALEGMFSWLVTRVDEQGLAGATVDELVAQLDEPTLPRSLSEILGLEVDAAFGRLTPSALCMAAGVHDGSLDEELSRSFDQKIPSQHPLAENSLESQIRSLKHLYSPAGLALPLILLAVTLARFAQWERSKWGTWLAGIAHDSYLDLVPPLVEMGLTRRFGDWWHTSFGDLAGFILNRYVVQQHQAMSYEKIATGERCLLEVDGSRVIATGHHEGVGMGNPRLRSATQILTDLGLVARDGDGVDSLTGEGEALLATELQKEGGA